MVEIDSEIIKLCLDMILVCRPERSQREKVVAEKMHRLENIRIKNRFNYAELHEISTEARQKLERINPETLAQASRIPGVSPSDINVLLVLLGR